MGIYNKNSYLYQKIVEIVHRLTVMINPRFEAKRCYKKIFEKAPNFNTPKNLIEKIYWLQFNTDTSLWTRCADKYAMREYVHSCGYDEYLPKNYGRWERVDEIDFNKLPNSFVLKANNGCGSVIIVKDKSTLDQKSTRKKLKQWLRLKYGWSGAELHYTRIKPCIIAEELLAWDESDSRSKNSQIDYKVWCFHGEPEAILLVYDRTRSGYCLDLYDTFWNRLSNNLKKNDHYRFNVQGFSKPSCLCEMLNIAKGLSAPFPEVRVDFYIVNNKPVIGELTFTTGYGYFTNEYYDYLGSKIKLDKV